MKAKVMLLLIFSFFGVCVTNGDSKRKYESHETCFNQEFIVTKANKRMGDANYEDQGKYEQLQHADYLNNRETYLKWPDMDYQTMKNLCNYFLSKIFRKSKNLVLIPEILPYQITLFYRIIKDKYFNPLPPIKVSVLQCYCPETSQRKYYHFIRGPMSHCYFLIKPVTCNWKHYGFCKEMVIVNKFCEESRNDDQHGEYSKITTQRMFSNTKGAIRKRLKMKSDEAQPHLRAYFEKAHLNNYNLKPDDCQSWPELNIIGKENFCKIFVTKILGPIVADNEVLPKVRESEKLIYMQVLSENNKNLKSVKLTMLQCRVPKARKLRRLLFQFIRAPSSKCVFLVKPTAQNLPQEFAIFNMYCHNIDPNN